MFDDPTLPLLVLAVFALVLLIGGGELLLAALGRAWRARS